MATNIKTYTVPIDGGLMCNDSYKLIQVLNDDVFIFYTKRVTIKHTLQYVRKSENWLIEHEIDDDIGMILDSCISYNEDLIFISYTDGTSGLVLFSTIDASDTITQYATGSNMGTDIDYFVMIPLLTGGGADEVYFIYGQQTPTALNYRTFVPSTTTLSAESTMPTTPETGLFWTRFNCTEYDDKVYFASACTQDANINGLCNLYLLAYDRLSDSFFWDLCVFKFDFAVDEGYIRTVITQGIATDGDSLHMQISVVGGSTVDYPSTDAFKIIKRATYIVYKDMLDGEWQKYCRLDDRLNNWLGYTVGGTVSRGNL